MEKVQGSISRPQFSNQQRLSEKIIFNKFLTSAPQQGLTVTFNNTEIKTDTLQKNNSKSKDKKWTVRSTIDAATVATYIAVISAAIYMARGKSKEVKLADQLANAQTAFNRAKDDLLAHGKLLNKENKQGSVLYRLFDAFGKLKENSEELTNNLVYGFGTLVVMPLVILYSPFGKKNASKEDRTFTVLRQPVSFATLFTMQLTFDKIFKTLISELNKYNLLDGIKAKDGKDLVFRSEIIEEKLKELLSSSPKKEGFTFNGELLNRTDEFKNEIEMLKKHMPNGKSINESLSIDEFTSMLKKLIDSSSSRKQIENMKKLIEHLDKDVPGLSELSAEVCNVARRNKSIKQFSIIIANSILSQALGIMMLNFVYGKAMKKYQEVKTNLKKPSNVNEGGNK